MSSRNRSRRRRRILNRAVTDYAGSFPQLKALAALEGWQFVNSPEREKPRSLRSRLKRSPFEVQLESEVNIDALEPSEATVARLHRRSSPSPL